VTYTARPDTASTFEYMQAQLSVATTVTAVAPVSVVGGQCGRYEIKGTLRGNGEGMERVKGWGTTEVVRTGGIDWGSRGEGE
jgi:hypothetical protein